MDLDVVIVNWNSGEYLARLLDSLTTLRSELSQLIVVDNGSSDTTFEVLAARPPVRLLGLGENRGFAAAANQGIAACTSAFVLLLNPDIEIEPASVRCLYERMRPQSTVAIGCPALIGADGTPQTDFQLRPLPSPMSVLSDVLFLDEVASLLFRRRSAFPSATPEGTVVDQPAAAFWMVRRTAWQELGGFDEAFAPAWFEDVDFCRRLKSARWEIRFFPDLKAFHRGAASLETLPRRDFLRTYHANMLRYLQKHHRAAYPFLWLPVKAGAWARMIFAK